MSDQALHIHFSRFDQLQGFHEIFRCRAIRACHGDLISPHIHGWELDVRFWDREKKKGAFPVQGLEGLIDRGKCTRAKDDLIGLDWRKVFGMIRERSRWRERKEVAILSTPSSLSKSGMFLNSGSL